MQLLLLLLFTVVVGTTIAMEIHTMTREQVEERYGAVNWNPEVRTTYCYQCVEIEVSSHGGALEHQPMRLGRFNVAGALWENMVPLFKAANGQYMTPDPNSNPVIYYLKWVISETVGGFNAGIQNPAYTDGINCPWDIPDQWQYEFQREWFVDPTLSVSCVRYRDEQ